jgi:hypothetical protein
VTSYRLFPSTDKPSCPMSCSGPFDAGAGSQVASGGVWFGGYRW